MEWASHGATPYFRYNETKKLARKAEERRERMAQRQKDKQKRKRQQARVASADDAADIARRKAKFQEKKARRIANKASTSTAPAWQAIVDGCEGFIRWLQFIPLSRNGIRKFAKVYSQLWEKELEIKSYRRRWTMSTLSSFF